MFTQLTEMWEDRITAFLTESDDTVTIHYQPTRSGSNVRFDSFHGESTDPADPSSIGVTETPTDTFQVRYGKTHLDLYGSSVGGAEIDQGLEIGKFSQSDVLYTCLLSQVKTSSDGEPIKTRFHNCAYVQVDKDKNYYKVDAIKTRGLGDAFLVDVFLTFTNRRDR
jgi:hypothetical protein